MVVTPLPSKAALLPVLVAETGGALCAASLRGPTSWPGEHLLGKSEQHQEERGLCRGGELDSPAVCLAVARERAFSVPAAPAPPSGVQRGGAHSRRKGEGQGDEAAPQGGPESVAGAGRKQQ